MMKKIMVILLCLSILLAGCGKKNAEPTTVPETTQTPTEEVTTAPAETEPPVPETVGGTALVDKTYVVLKTLDREETVEIAGEYDEQYYIVKTESGYGLMEKCLVRLEGEEAYTGWTGYAVYNARVFDNYHLRPDNVKNLYLNTQVEVLEDLGDLLVVKYEDAIGYMLPGEVSQYYIQPSAGGGGGGGDAGGADGGDISLGNHGSVIGLSTFVPQSGEVSGNATVLVNGAEIILGWFDREDVVAIVNEDGFVEAKEGWYAVYHEGLYGYVRREMIHKDGDEVYAEWDGYALYPGAVYDNYYLRGTAVANLYANAPVHVLCDLGNCYLVTSGETTGYMAKEHVSQTYISYGGGGGGESSGGDWTPPAM